MKRIPKRRSRQLVTAGGAIAGALTSLLSVGACVTNLSYRYVDPNEGGVTEAGGTDGRRDDGESPTRSCSRMLLVGGNVLPSKAPTGISFYGAVAGTNVRWTVAPALPYASATHGSLLVGDHVVVAGGLSDYDRFTTFAGSAWRPLQKLPGKGAGCFLVSLTPSDLYLLCSNDGDADGGLQSAFYGKDNGNTVSWVDAKPSEKLQPGSTAVAVGGRLLVVGPDLSAQLGTPTPGDPRSIDWKQASNRPVAGNAGCAVAVDDRAYFIGGDQTPVVLLARVSGDTLTWPSTAIQPLPQALSSPACLYANGRIWVAGGALSSDTYVDTMYSARVTADGIDEAGWVLSDAPLQNPVVGASLACLP